MESRPLKRIDILRHELKALRFMLDNYHAGKIEPATIPPRDDFQSDQSRRIYDMIMRARSRAAAGCVDPRRWYLAHAGRGAAPAHALGA